jgi:hypothetical protein
MVLRREIGPSWARAEARRPTRAREVFEDKRMGGEGCPDNNRPTQGAGLIYKREGSEADKRWQALSGRAEQHYSGFTALSVRSSHAISVHRLRRCSNRAALQLPFNDILSSSAKIFPLYRLSSVCSPFLSDVLPLTLCQPTQRNPFFLQITIGFPLSGSMCELSYLSLHVVCSWLS